MGLASEPAPLAGQRRAHLVDPCHHHRIGLGQRLPQPGIGWWTTAGARGIGGQPKDGDEQDGTAAIDGGGAHRQGPPGWFLSMDPTRGDEVPATMSETFRGG